MKQTVQFFIPIRAAVLREPGCPLKIERLEMEGPRKRVRPEIGTGAGRVVGDLGKS